MFSSICKKEIGNIKMPPHPLSGLITRRIVFQLKRFVNVQFSWKHMLCALRYDLLYRTKYTRPLSHVFFNIWSFLTTIRQIFSRHSSELTSTNYTAHSIFLHLLDLCQDFCLCFIFWILNFFLKIWFKIERICSHTYACKTSNYVC